MGDFENKKDEFVGKAKEAYGDATDDKQLENEGKGEQAVAGAKEKLADVADTLKNKANEVIGNFKKD
ncbi:MAG: CsbD family protein [Corynebacterium sp.]|nr:CsbD family protein [Corynebacterium sp.]